MKISIINSPEKWLEILYIAGRNCYGLIEFDKLPSNEELEKFLKKIIMFDHGSVLEHVNITVLLEDVSRSLMAQLTRHRHASFCVKSQHYVVHKNFKYKSLEYSGQSLLYDDLMASINRVYEQLLADGVPKYIAREVLPNAALTNIVMTANIRELRHIIKIRITKHNTPEIIKMSELLLDKLIEIMPGAFEDLK